MCGTPSFSTTSVSLPIARRICEQASTEPTASPSGRACDVSTNCWRRSISCSTCASVCISTAFLATLFFASSLYPTQQLIDPCALLVAAIDLKVKLRRLAQVQAEGKLAPNKQLRRLKTLERLLGLVVFAIKMHKHPRGSAIRRHQDVGHAGQSDPWIDEFAFYDRRDLVAQGIAQAFLVMFCSAAFHSHLIPAHLSAVEETHYRTGTRALLSISNACGPAVLCTAGAPGVICWPVSEGAK